jgi:hydrogenase expression/formation protein HypC
MCLGIPMRVVELQAPDKARVESGNVSMEVSLLLVDDVKVGDYVLVHAGFALEVMDVAAAEETIELLSQVTLE